MLKLLGSTWTDLFFLHFQLHFQTDSWDHVWWPISFHVEAFYVLHV